MGFLPPRSASQSAAAVRTRVLGRADHKPIRQIVRELRISRQTVRKAIRGSSTEFRYERQVQPQPRLGAFVGRLGALLEANSKRPARERLTARRLFELLRAEGYEGAYDSVQRHVREWRRRQSQLGPVFIPLWFAPGEAYQFDWSHEVVVLGGVTTTVKVAHVRLCHSRMFLVQAYPRESQEIQDWRGRTRRHRDTCQIRGPLRHRRVAARLGGATPPLLESWSRPAPTS